MSERELKPCGTYGAYQRHVYRGEPIDDACRDAKNEYQNARMARARAAGRMAQQIARVRALHQPFGIYDECGHQHTEQDLMDEVPGVFELDDVGITCVAGHQYSVCKHCCTHDGWHTEHCASDHDHGKNKPICPTVAALDGGDQ